MYFHQSFLRAVLIEDNFTCVERAVFIMNPVRLQLGFPVCTWLAEQTPSLVDPIAQYCQILLFQCELFFTKDRDSCMDTQLKSRCIRFEMKATFCIYSGIGIDLKWASAYSVLNVWHSWIWTASVAWDADWVMRVQVCRIYVSPLEVNVGRIGPESSRR